MKPLPYGKQLIDADDIAAVAEQLGDDWLTQGPTVAKFEAALCEITGAKFAVAMSSGTAALHLACLAAGVGPGDVGVTSTNTFVASANGIRYCGGTPRMVDIDAETGLMSLRALDEAVRAVRPKVIVPVDFAGAVADLPAIAKHGAVVIEDAAHSLGAEYTHGGRSYRAGSCAHTQMAILSFHPVKHLTTGEGGAVTTNDPALDAKLRELRTHGITRDPQRLTRNDGPWYQEQQSLGYNYRLTDLQCALGLSQAKKFPGFLARRRQIAAQYDAAFAKAPFVGQLVPLRVRDGVTSAYHLYVVRFSGPSLEAIAARRKAVYMALRDAAIFAQVHYVPVHAHPDYAPFVAGQQFPGCDAYYASCLSLPMYPALTDGDVERVVATLGTIVSG
ncbi:MAG: UDP-4-amino-4,6-dideoxy-N-acetyl-beta-L-altrosamine transaminase [Deltaproteobacteria bacterium]|nr:UDP-4-amino-4,6-dideoxy-N-acetyl-beta-L-altrosamine transaminase [Deltaproteobacteria bacterium]